MYIRINFKHNKRPLEFTGYLLKISEAIELSEISEIIHDYSRLLQVLAIRLDLV